MHNFPVREAALSSMKNTFLDVQNNMQNRMSTDLFFLLTQNSSNMVTCFSTRYYHAIPLPKESSGDTTSGLLGDGAFSLELFTESL